MADGISIYPGDGVASLNADAARREIFKQGSLPARAKRYFNNVPPCLGNGSNVSFDVCPRRLIDIDCRSYCSLRKDSYGGNRSENNDHAYYLQSPIGRHVYTTTSVTLKL